VLDSEPVLAARRKLEDEFLPIRRAVAAIKKAGGIVDDANNTDAKLDTYHGKVAERYRDVERTTILPIIDTMSRANLIPLDDDSSARQSVWHVRPGAASPLSRPSARSGRRLPAAGVHLLRRTRRRFGIDRR
jgi:hypothetical protein